MTRTVSTNLTLANLPYPESLQSPKFETIFNERLASLKKRFEAKGITFDVENLLSDPAVIIEDEDAYREWLDLKAMINLAKENMVAFAGAEGLAHLGALFGPQRFVIEPGNPDAIPVKLPLLEPVEEYRQRIMEAPETYPYAGLTGGAYKQIALAAANGRLKDVKVLKRWDNKGHPVMSIILLVRDAFRTQEAEILAAVRAAFPTEGETSQLTDIITIRVARDLPYALHVILEVPRGPDPALIRDAATDALVAQVDVLRLIGEPVPLDALYAAARVGNVRKVHLNLEDDIVPASDEAAQAINVTVETEIVDAR